jgi:ribosome-binding factor A
VADKARSRRLAKRIARIVASALEHDTKDPRLARVTITDAKITADLRDATVYYTVLPESLDAEPDAAGAAIALERAKGNLRTLVGQRTGVRYTPTLEFVADTVPDDARRIDELLASARQSDAEVAMLATDAEPAGEADPYRPDRIADDADES